MLRIFISVILCLAQFFHSVLADGLSYSDGTLKGTAQCTKVGSLFADDLTVLINGTNLELRKSGQDRPVASGTVFKASVKDNRLTGLCYFRRGERLSEILGKNAGTPDLIENRSGEQIVCRIEDLDSEMILFVVDGSQKQMMLSDLHSISSANVFRFSAQLKSGTEADNIVFSSTCDKSLARRSRHQALGPVDNTTIPDRVIGFAAGMLAITAIAGIVLPLSIALPIASYHRKMRNRRNSQLNEVLVRRFLPRPVASPLRRNNNNNNNNI